MDWDERSPIIQCLGCETVSFYVELTHSEDSDYCPEKNTLIRNVNEQYYLSRTNQFRELNVYLLPPNVQGIYRETIVAISYKLAIIASIGIRALIETVCKEQKAKGKDLYKKIDSLYDMSIVTKEGAATLHKLRNLGNEAAHEAKPQMRNCYTWLCKLSTICLKVHTSYLNE
jgi:hypothetical protein